VVLVANHLGVERFGILGVSGGSPTAIAAAGELSDRVTTLSVVSGVSPIQDRYVLSGMNFANRGLLRIGGVVPGIGKGVIAMLASLWRLNPIVAQLWFRMLLPEPDLAIGRRPEVSRVMVRAIREGLRQGVQGAANDFELLLSDWRHLVERVRVPSHVWHGDVDTYVPLAMGQLLARGIPGAVFHKVEGGGHFMIVDRLVEILEMASARG
jgi:pimeloyl-ACP methyl ester carboxylesterase